MSNIDKIRQEIERRKKICEGIFERESDTYYQGKAVAYGELLDFINSLPDEKPSEDLEEAAEEYLETQEVAEIFCGSYEGWQVSDAFIAGAEWHEQQMMKDAVEGIVCATITGTNATGDKVKLIIVKNEE